MIHTCENCNAEIDIKFYFSDIKITKQEYIPHGTVDWYANAKGEAICYRCGTRNVKHFKSMISQGEIIELATGEVLPK